MRDIKAIAERAARQAEERRRNLAGVAAQSRQDARELRGVSTQVGGELKEREDVKPLLNLPGFYPTLPGLARFVVDRAEIEPGMLILEPEAGKGDIVRVVLALCQGVTVECCEIQPELQGILNKKGYSVVAGDCFELPPDAGPYDRILMNPPFERGADAQHVRHVFQFLKAGGRLISIMAPGAFFHRRERWAQEFQGWLAGLRHTVEDLPPGCFLGAERSTGVNTKLLTINNGG